jgi:predicted MFS family arabinose efflux permease
MPSTLSAAGEWRRYWPLVLAAGIGFSFQSFMSPATGLFMAPLQEEFGWSRTLLSSGSAIGAAISLLLSPFFGVLFDRHGSRRMAIGGLIATALAIAAFATLTGAPAHWLGLWLLFGLASMSVHATTWTSAVAGVFNASKGLALGITLAGSALAAAVVPPLTNWLIAEVGWRAAFVWLGLGWGGLALILSYAFLFDAHDHGRSAVRETGGARAVPSDRPGLTIAQAWRDTALWRVALATLITLSVTIGIAVHLVPIIVGTGITRTSAAWIASLSGVAGIGGKLVTGALIDRFHARWIGGATLASTALAYPLLIVPDGSTLLIIVAILINGYAGGTKLQLCGYLTARYAGMKNYGAIFGFMSSMVALAAGLGPVLAGLAFDRTGSYTPFLIGGTIISLVSGALVFSLGRYPLFSQPDRPDGR